MIIQQFIYSTVDECLSCFQLFVIMNKAGMIIPIQVPCVHVFILGRLLSHMINIYEMLCETVKLFSKVVLLF